MLLKRFTFEPGFYEFVSNRYTAVKILVPEDGRQACSKAPSKKSARRG
jgi:hypothetical protein